MQKLRVSVTKTIPQPINDRVIALVLVLLGLSMKTTGNTIWTGELSIIKAKLFGWYLRYHNTKALINVYDKMSLVDASCLCKPLWNLSGIFPKNPLIQSKKYMRAIERETMLLSDTGLYRKKVNSGD